MRQAQAKTPTQLVTALTFAETEDGRSMSAVNLIEYGY